MSSNQLLPPNPVADAIIEWNIRQSSAQTTNAILSEPATLSSMTYESLSSEAVVTAALLFSVSAAVGVVVNKLNHVGHRNKVPARPSSTNPTTLRSAAEEEEFRDAA